MNFFNNNDSFKISVYKLSWNLNSYFHDIFWKCLTQLNDSQEKRTAEEMKNIINKQKILLKKTFHSRIK